MVSMVNRDRIKSLKHLFLLLQLVVLIAFLSVNAERDGVMVTQANYQSLQAIKHAFFDPRGILSSWNDTGAGACSGRWVGIKCAGGQVIAIQLPWRGLGGHISEKIGQLSGLRKLSLHDNYLGGMIPTSLGFLPNLRGVHLFNNRLSGSIPPSLGSCPLLQTIHLSNNLLTGPIPPSLANSSRIYRVNLSYNGLSGPIPFSLTRSPSLSFLALQYNNLSGSIPNTWGGGSGATKPPSSYELRELTIDHNSITGSIPVSLSKMDKLQVISLSRNQISGVIPSELGTLLQLQTLDVSNNLITGSFPTSLCSVHSLVHLDLQGNRLENQVPEAIGGLQNLSVLDLRRNQFKGHIPNTLGKISSLTHLDLSQNNFSGDIPVSVADLTHLTFFNVSYNNLSGFVPIPLSQKFNSSSFIGNLQLCGYSISTPCSSPPPSETLSPQVSAPRRHRRKLSTKDIILIAAGILLAILLLLCCILFYCLIRRRAARRNGRTTGRTAAARGDKAIPAGAAAATGSHVEEGGDAGGKLVHFDGTLVFTADDLLCATAEIMGKSSYGTVYKATFEDGNQVAVKRLREKIAKAHREFEAEVNLLGKIRHPNLSSLRAYYIGPKGEKLLVFDFMPRGSLGAFLHARGPDAPINWTTRMNLMIGTARGLCYLHTDQNMVHGNLSGGNVLLDEQMNPKVSDYGLSRLMTTTANSNVATTAASLGYRAPELSKIKKPSTKTDVYSLGVIMLELLTGKSPSEATNGMDLPQWVASIVKEEWTNEVFDMELMRDASTTGDELLNTLKLALHCVDPSPTERPDVQQVLQQLEEIKPELAARDGGDDTGGPSTNE